MGRLSWILVGWLALLPATHAASFDCAKAATNVEKLICGDSQLSQLDSALSVAYKHALQRSDDKQKVVQGQRLWIKDVRNACADAVCLTQAYNARLQQVQVMASPPAMLLAAPAPVTATSNRQSTTSANTPPKFGNLRGGAAHPCVNAYYGIGEPTDYTKAYQCFKEQNVANFIILMTLNGEGTPKDPELAKKTMDMWFQAEPWASSEVDGNAIRNAVAQHVQDPNSPRVDFCKDLAESTYSMGFCSGVDEQLQKQESGDSLRAIGDSFTPPQRAKWNEVLQAKERYAKLEGDRILKQYEDGSIRGVAYDSQIMLVRGNFDQLASEVFVNHNLDTLTPDERKQLDSQMRAAYQTDIDDYVEGQSYLDQSNSSADDKQKYAKNVADYKQIAADSQQAWENLAKLLAELAADIDKTKGTNMVASITADLTQARIGEIKNSPG